MKSKIPKLVAALVLGLGVANSAMAASEVGAKVQPFALANYPDIKGNADGICKKFVEEISRELNPGMNWQYLGQAYINTSIHGQPTKSQWLDCRVGSPLWPPELSLTLGASIICPNLESNPDGNSGWIFADHPDGCYLKPTEPQPEPEPDFCEQARKVGESPLPEGCYDPCRNMQSKNSEIGGVVCLNDTDRHICVWKKGLDENEHTNTPISREIIRLCARPHEQSHIDTEKEFGVCRDGRLGPMGEKDTPERERNFHGAEYPAFEASIKCLNDNMVRCTEYAAGSPERGYCLGDITREINRMKTARDIHKNALGL